MSKCSCDYCGGQIKWIQVAVETVNGQEVKNIAVDVTEPVYHHDGERWVQSRAFVNHFAVCPFRRKWRKSQIEKKQNFEKDKEKNGAPWWAE